MKWLTLFPLNVIGWMATTKRIGTYKGTPVHRLPWHPFGKFSMAFADRIAVHKGHIHSTGNNDHHVISKKLLQHELVHCQDQIEWGAIAFLTAYAVDYVIQFFHPKGSGFFNFKQAYRNVTWEKRARRLSRDLDGHVFFTLDGRTEVE